MTRPPPGTGAPSPPTPDANAGIFSLPPGVNADAAKRLAATALLEAGIESSDVDARLLLQHALTSDRAALAAAPDRVLTPEEATAFARMIARRAAHEPVARIVGEKEFWSLRLMLNAATLVPRPDTETVVAAALAAVDRHRNLHIADLGTGSGALLLALLSELPHARGVGTDIATDALVMARANAQQLALATRATFVACNYGAALRGPYDLVASNPPYIPSGDIAGLEADVRDYDPRRALDGGPDGLDAYRAIAQDAGRLLAPGGALIVELGLGQADGVRAAFALHGLPVIGVKNDISGRPRALTVTRPS